MTDDAERSPLTFCTTPALRAVFDERLPGHDYGTAFPATLLLDPVMADVSSLSLLLRGTRVHHRPTAAVVSEGTKDKENHRRRMAALEADLTESSYQSLVAPRETLSTSGLTIASVLPDGHDADADADGRQAKMMKNQISTIVNIAISMATAAMAAWYWTPQGVGLPQRLLVCFASAIALGAAEVFLYLRYLVKIDQGRRHNRHITRQENKKNA